MPVRDFVPSHRTVLSSRSLVLSLLVLFAPAAVFAQLDDARIDDYNQWRMALSGANSGDATISARPGFRVEVVRKAEPNEGSWISLTFDPKGRPVIGREDRGLLRLTLSEQGGVQKVESIEETLLEPRGLLFAHGRLFVHANNSKGLYRLTDTDGDDRFDEVKLLKRTEGGVGHGRNGLALGPDGMIYMVMGNNVELPSPVSPDSPFRRFAQDRLLPCVWNEFLFDYGVKPPAGYIARTGANGETWELVAGGFRNPYDLAFNADGDLFTYDADMEWDAGAPWYRPTCVMHVVPGGEYGWRQGTSVWPDEFPDALQRVVDIGLGSPTGVAFAHGSKFPEPYRSALFIQDWAYGRIIAVHLSPRGASYTGKAETFLKGRPLNVTDIAVGPDGAMYFTVGGRRTQSALYRVSWAGTSAEKAPDLAVSRNAEPRNAERDAAAGKSRALRRQISELRPESAAKANLAIKYLGDEDPWIRHAARIVIENASTDAASILELPAANSTAKLNLLLSAARLGSADSGEKFCRTWEALSKLELTEAQRMLLWRSAQLALLRGGPFTTEQRAALRTAVEKTPPEIAYGEERLVCELLTALESPDVIPRALAFFDRAKRPEEKLFALDVLRNHRAGWTVETRRRYFEAFKVAEQFSGAQYMGRFQTYIRTDALATLTDGERTALAPLLATLGKPPVAATPPQSRPFVKAWTMEEVVPHLGDLEKVRPTDRGRELFAAARCRDCHRFRGEGTAFGPDLTGAASRFGRKDLLETILLPSKVVDEKYRTLLLETDEGDVLTGTLAGGDAETLAIAVNPQEPTQIRRIRRSSIVTRKSSSLSPMPEGLLNTLKRDEILELLAYLESSDQK